MNGLIAERLFSWQQATLPMRLGGLGIRQASGMVYAAYLGSCSDFKDIVRQLLGIQRDSDFTGADPEGVQRVPWNPPFERASLTRDTLIEQSNRDTLIEQSQ